VPNDVDARELDRSVGGEALAADTSGVDALLPVVYEELHALAQSVLHHHNRSFDAMRTTSLVNDVYVRLAARGLKFNDRGHFLCLAARAMRLILIDRARQMLAAKRGGGKIPGAFSDIIPAAGGPDLLSLDDALAKLAAFDARKSRIVELRFFGGLSIDETAEALQVSAATVKREWTLARAWLYREVGDGSVEQY
jgi:RNA polymerase sigma factor (TIGR02999 family)